MSFTYISGPELARRQADAALAEALDVLSGALRRAVASAREEERAAERAAVVAWLRRVATHAGDLYHATADHIERGEHRREESE